jgi:hypothetical protein
VLFKQKRKGKIYENVEMGEHIVNRWKYDLHSLFKSVIINHQIYFDKRRANDEKTQAFKSVACCFDAV